MPQQDKFKREIDKIGLVLARLLGLLLNKTNHQDTREKDVIQQVQDELDIDLPAFLEMDGDASITYLVEGKRFSNDHLRVFANMLYELSVDTTDHTARAKLRNKALCAYEYIHANAVGTLYLDVEYRIKELRGS